MHQRGCANEASRLQIKLEKQNKQSTLLICKHIFKTFFIFYCQAITKIQIYKLMIKHSYLQIAKKTCFQNTKILNYSTNSPNYFQADQFTKLSLSHMSKMIQYFSTYKKHTQNIDQNQSNYKKYNLQVKQVTPQNVVECVDLVSRNFSQFQPLRQAYYTKFPCEPSQRINFHNKYYLQYQDQFLENQLSKIASQKDNTNNRQIIKSVMLAKDFSYISPNISSYMDTLNIFSAVSALHSQTKRVMKSQWAHILKQTQRGKIAHFWLGATVPQLASAKLFSSLMVKGQQKAVEKGYRFIIVWATNHKSGKISSKLNYQCISSVDTHTVQIYGQRPFELAPQENRFCTVWGKFI